MKKAFILLSVALLFFPGCYKEDISILYNRQHELEKKLEEIKTIVNNLNGEIDLIKILIDNLGDDDGIVSVTDLPDGSGYVITFRKSGEKIIRHGYTPYIGKNGNWFIDNRDTGVRAAGDDGETPHIGKNGNWWLGDADTGVRAEGTPGSTPVVGIARDPQNPSDENLYWTRRIGDGAPEFILIDGQKIKANGTSGVTPVVGIRQDTDGMYYWTVTVPPAAETWLLADGQKVKAVGTDGQDGSGGVSIFKSVDYSNDDFVIFVLNTDPETSFTVPKYKTITLEMEDGSLAFESFGQTKLIPFTVSENVVAVHAYSPDGWRSKVDMAARVLSLTAPDIRNEFAELTGRLTLIAFDNKGLSTSVFADLSIGGTLALTFRRSNGAALTEALVPYGLRAFYFPANGAHYNGSLDQDMVSSPVVVNGIFQTGKQNRTTGWSVVTMTNEPNVTWDDYNPTGDFPADLSEVEASLKEDPDRTGYFLPLASNNLNFYWKKTDIPQGTELTDPVQVNHSVSSAKVEVRITNANRLEDPETGLPVDPRDVWISFGGQGRAIRFADGQVSPAVRGALPLTGAMAVDFNRLSGTTAYFNVFGTFGSLKPLTTDPGREIDIRIMTANTVLGGVRFGTSGSIDMGSNYIFVLDVRDTGSLGVSITVNGWGEVWLYEEW